MRKLKSHERHDYPIESESHLRVWLRKNWLDDLWGPLIWVEAARGGTVGAPDVFVPIPGQGYVPVELKYWPRKKILKSRYISVSNDIRPHMRPAQRRLHLKIGASGYRSVVLSYIGFGEIGLAVGYRIAEEMNSSVVHRRTLTIDEFRNLLMLASFWKDNQNAKLACSTSDDKLRKEHRKRTRRTER